MRERCGRRLARPTRGDRCAPRLTARAWRQPRCLAARWTRVARERAALKARQVRWMTGLLPGRSPVRDRLLARESERAADRIPQQSGRCTRAAPASARHARSRRSHAPLGAVLERRAQHTRCDPRSRSRRRPRSCAPEHRQPGRVRWQSRRSRLAGLIEAEAAAYELTRGGGGTRPGGHHRRGDNTRAAESPAWRGKQSRCPAQPTATLSEQRTAGRNHEAQSSWSPVAGPVGPGAESRGCIGKAPG